MHQVTADQLSQRMQGRFSSRKHSIFHVCSCVGGNMYCRPGLAYACRWYVIDILLCLVKLQLSDMARSELVSCRVQHGAGIFIYKSSRLDFSYRFSRLLFPLNRMRKVS